MGNSSSRTRGKRSADRHAMGAPSTQHRATYNHELGMEVTEHLYDEQRVLYEQLHADQAKAAEQAIRQQRELQAIRGEREALAAHARQQGELQAIRERERLAAHARQQGELQAIRERERLAEQARQQRELQVSRERERLAAHARQQGELQAIRERERLDEQARQQRELQAIQELERVRLERLHASQVCRRHNTRQGCNNASCRRLHVCRLYLANICKHGVTCRYGHSLTTVHNQVICDRYGLDTAQEQTVLEKLRRDFAESEELPAELYVKNIERCFKYGSRNPCWQGNCNRLHICRQYVAGTCSRARCKFGHDLRNTHNAEVLSRHRAWDMSNDEIQQLLRGKDNKTTDKSVGGAGGGGSTSPSAPPLATEAGAKGGGGAGKLAVSAGAGASAGASAGLSEELTCPVCLDMFSRATTLGCGHTFCADCLQETRNRSGNTCPLCRAAISSAIRSVTLDNIIRNVLANQ